MGCPVRQCYSVESQALRPPVSMVPISVARHARNRALCREGRDPLQSALAAPLRNILAVQGNRLLLHALST